jgi:regulator of RNase E activity RraB
MEWPVRLINGYLARRHRMPSSDDISHRMQMDLAIKKQLQSHNDNEDAIHTVEHHFVAEQRSTLESVAKIGRMLGFGASEIAEGTSKSGQRYFYFDLLSESGTRLNDVARQSILMFSLGEAYGAMYDGWGTLIAE